MNKIETMTWDDVLRLTKANPKPDRKVTKTKEEWKALLTPEQFRVTREHATERAFTGEYCELVVARKYNCVCFDIVLCRNSTKPDSNRGRPSFTTPVKDNVNQYRNDRSWVMTDKEVLSNVCDEQL